MLRGTFAALLDSLMWWRQTPSDHQYLRCAECGTVVDGDGLLRHMARAWWTADGRHGADRTPDEWTCPACGRDGPLAVGEELENDITVRCRRHWICRHTFDAPSAVDRVACPRCYTEQSPRPRRGRR